MWNYVTDLRLTHGKYILWGAMAQRVVLVERRTGNRKIMGSNPTSSASVAFFTLRLKIICTGNTAQIN